MQANNSLATTFEILKAVFSFKRLAETGSINRAAKTLDVSRHTLRRHIQVLRCLNDDPLFELSGGAQQLTNAGRSLNERINPLFRTVSQLLNEAASSENLDISTDDLKYFSQRHSLLDIDANVPLISKAYKSWMSSGGRLNEAPLSLLRPWILTYRETKQGWICIHVGEKSSFATWMGTDWAASAIGRSSETDVTGERFSRTASEGYYNVMLWGSPRLEHVTTKIARNDTGKREWVSYQRLLLPCVLPEGDRVLTSIAARTNNVLIKSQRGKKKIKMPAELLMEDEIDL